MLLNYLTAEFLIKRQFQINRYRKKPLSTGKPHITYSRIATPSYKGQKSRYNDNSSCNLI